MRCLKRASLSLMTLFLGACSDSSEEQGGLEGEALLTENYLFSALQHHKNIQAFRLNNSKGDLSFTFKKATESGPLDIKFHTNTRTLFSTHPESHLIQFFRLDHVSQELKLLNKLDEQAYQPSNEEIQLQQIALHPNLPMIYVSLERKTEDGPLKGMVVAYEFNSADGTLNRLEGKETEVEQARKMAVAKDGSLLHVMNTNAEDGEPSYLTSFELDEDGAMGAKHSQSPQITEEPGRPEDFTLNPSSKILYVSFPFPEPGYVGVFDVADQKPKFLNVYLFDNNNENTEKPRGVAFHPNGFLYVSGSENEESKNKFIKTYSVSANGKELTSIQRLELGTEGPSHLELHPEARVLYGTNPYSNEIQSFKIQPNGLLEAPNATVLPEGSNPLFLETGQILGE